jgi:diphosphomevalonate decarboxylase
MSVIPRASKIAWSAPSNIAFVKYWGKTGRQYPLNASLSMTLNQARTETSIEVLDDTTIGVDFQLAGEEDTSFAKRIHTFIVSILDIYPEFKNKKFIIKSENTFPHSAGIASSASAYAA